jgi:pimeloyl-ACP methyl ester carboxylesterase
MSVNATTRTLELPDARIVYDVRGPIPTTDGRPVLLMIGQPMEASGFTALASYFGDRTVVTYDPRGLGRSTRNDGGRDNDPVQHAADLHALVAELDAGPVEVFGSSGGAVDGLALVQAHPEDVAVLVAHEPPLTHLLPDAALVRRAEQANEQAYRENGFGAGMARFIAFTSWEGPITEEFLAAPAPDPAMFGLPTEDDGSRDDPLLSGDSAGVVALSPDPEKLRATGTRIVVAAGEESARQVTGRCAAAVAARLGVPLTIFPSHHGGFLDAASGWGGRPEAFAAKLREVLTV